MVAQIAQIGTIYKVGYRTRPDGQLVVRALGRAKDGSRIDRDLLGTEPHFFVSADEEETARNTPGVVSIAKGPPGTDHRPTLRIGTRIPTDVRNLRERFKRHYEADILYGIRTRVDYRLVHVTLPPGNPLMVKQVQPIEDPVVTPRVLHFDLEVDDAYGFSEIEDATNSILSSAFFDTGKEAFGVIYSGPPIDPETVRQRIVEHLREAKPGFEFPWSIRLFPVENEADVIGGFGQMLAKADPDVVSAWNGNKFDFPYLGRRVDRFMASGAANSDVSFLDDSFDAIDQRPNGTRQMGHEHRNRGRYVLIDPMAVFKKQELRQRSFALENVAKDVLGFGKIQREESVSALRKRDLAQFLAYNLVDVFLLWQIDLSEQLTTYAIEEAAIASIEAEDIEHNSRVIDGTLLTEASLAGEPYIVLPSKDFAPHVSMGDGKGAEVFPTVVGLWVGVIALDLSGSYPNTERTWNISSETKVRDESLFGETRPVYRLPTGGVYLQQPEGLIPRSIRRLQTARNREKNAAKAGIPGSKERKRHETVSKALKHVLASYTGVMNSPEWRLSDVGMFNDVTGMARLALQWNKHHLEDPEWLASVLGPGVWAGRVLLGDTDSCYFVVFHDGLLVIDPEVLIGYAKLLRDAINASYAQFIAPTGAKESFINVDIEGVFAPLRTLPKAGGETGAKKRYFGAYAFEGEKDVRHLPLEKRLKFSGLEIKRFNNAPITREVQKTAIETVVRDGTESSIAGYLDTVQTAVLAGKRDEDLLIQTKASRSEANQPHLRAMRLWTEITGKAIRGDEEFHWLYVTRLKAPGRSPEPVEHQNIAFAFPMGTSLAELRSKGWELTIDYSEMYRKTVYDPVKLVCPEIEGGTWSLADI